MELRRRRRNSRVGLTLVELVVVLGILAVLATFAYPRYSSHKASLESVSKEALSLFHLAQQQAHATYGEQRVSFNRTLFSVSSIEMKDLNDTTITVSDTNDDYSIAISHTLDAVIFSPTNNVRGVLGLSKIDLTEPVIVSFLVSLDVSRNIIIYPRSKRVQLK